jgi:transcriptional regulator with XRE-family HTH domain
MLESMARRKRPAPPSWTPNQIVAHNLAKARLFRGWTQDRAAEACAPYLGTRLSPASWSAIERSVDGNRIKQVSVDELVAFARAFDLPVGWFLTPPSVWDEHVVSTPDAGPDGLDPEELFDVVIGTEENLATWEQYLLSWPNPASRMRVYDDGTIENLGRVQDDVHERVRVNNTLRARMALRQQFGDLDAARAALTQLAHALEDVDDPVATPSDTEQPSATRNDPPATRRSKT